MSLVIWDTNLFIYLLEDYQGLSERVGALRRRMLTRGDRLCTSTLTLGEVLVKPSESGDRELQYRFEELLQRGADLIPFDANAARHYAEIRADRSIRPPDALQLACAASAGVDLFITNDDRLRLKVIRGIQFLTSLDRADL